MEVDGGQANIESQAGDINEEDHDVNDIYCPLSCWLTQS
jgi:hypothetical protein